MTGVEEWGTKPRYEKLLSLPHHGGGNDGRDQSRDDEETELYYSTLRAHIAILAESCM